MYAAIDVSGSADLKRVAEILEGLPQVTQYVIFAQGLAREVPNFESIAGVMGGSSYADLVKWAEENDVNSGYIITDEFVVGLPPKGWKVIPY